MPVTFGVTTPLRDVSASGLRYQVGPYEQPPSVGDAIEGAVNVTLDTLAFDAEGNRIRAPFAGKLGIRQVNLGQYLNPGTALTVLESLEGVYIDFTVPQQQLANVPVGVPFYFGTHYVALHLLGGFLPRDMVKLCKAPPPSYLRLQALLSGEVQAVTATTGSDIRTAAASLVITGSLIRS